MPQNNTPSQLSGPSRFLQHHASQQNKGISLPQFSPGGQKTFLRCNQIRLTSEFPSAETNYLHLYQLIPTSKIPSSELRAQPGVTLPRPRFVSPLAYTQPAQKLDTQNNDDNRIYSFTIYNQTFNLHRRS